MSRLLLLLIVAAVLLVDGYVYGLWTGRWHESHELQEAAARLDRLPLTVGDWQGTPKELDPKAVKIAQFAGYTVRRYENRRTGSAVSLLVACGRPGPLAVHTPQICFPGAGYRMTGEPTRSTLDLPGGAAAEYWTTTFKNGDDTVPEQVRVVWLWNAKGAWSAPDNPRWQFAGLPVLYKIYVTQEYLPRNEETDGDDCRAFLREIIPELDKVIAANP
jgi:hypothetical protein